MAGLSLLRTGLAKNPPGWDLIVVGGGTAGIPTGLFASRRARVLILEKGPILGGTLDRSTGQVAAAGTVFQAEKGIEDSPQAHFDDIMRINGGTSDPALTRLFVTHAGPTLNWLAGLGYAVEAEHPVTGEGHEHYRTARYQWSARGGWPIYEAMAPLVNTAVDTGRLDVMLNTSAVELIIDGSGAVAGVVAESADGRRQDLRSSRVVLASGGCASNPTLFRELHDVPLYCQIAHPNSQGVGITLGQAAGGYVRGGEHYASLVGAVLAHDRHPAPMTAYSSLNATRRQPWELLVNTDGERFVQEDHPSIDHIEHAVAAQEDHRHFVIFDAEILAQAPPLLEGWSADKIIASCGEHPMFHEAESLGALGGAAGIDPDGLIGSVERYNDARQSGRPDPFARGHRPLPIVKPPYYAIEMRGWTVISFAGIAVDDQLRVVTGEQRPIPNLYAVGEVIGAGATSGAAYTNGMLVTPALTFGRLLGERILTFGA
ncbi:MAG: FAD-binding protein [Pseudomonadota bacterium]